FLSQIIHTPILTIDEHDHWLISAYINFKMLAYCKRCCISIAHMTSTATAPAKGIVVRSACFHDDVIIAVSILLSENRKVHGMRIAIIIFHFKVNSFLSEGPRIV